MEWLQAPDYWLMRLVFECVLGAIYLIAFIVAINQFRPLLGERGLLPVPVFIRLVPYRQAPSIFQFHYSDCFFAVLTWLGAVVSAAVVVGVPDRLPDGISIVVWLFLWAVYLSIVNVGQTFYGGLADVVRGDVVAAGARVVHPVHRQAAGGGSGDAEAAAAEPVPGASAALHPGAVLPVPVHDPAGAARDRGVVGADAGGRVLPAASLKRSAPDRHALRDGHRAGHRAV
jgi:hypothetical protein